MSVPAHTMEYSLLGHILSPGGVVAGFLAFFGLVPVIIGTLAAAAGLIFYVIQIGESATVQTFLAHRYERWRKKKVAALRVELEHLERNEDR